MKLKLVQAEVYSVKVSAVSPDMAELVINDQFKFRISADSLDDLRFSCSVADQDRHYFDMLESEGSENDCGVPF